MLRLKSLPISRPKWLRGQSRVVSTLAFRLFMGTTTRLSGEETAVETRISETFLFCLKIGENFFVL